MEASLDDISRDESASEQEADPDEAEITIGIEQPYVGVSFPQNRMLSPESTNSEPEIDDPTPGTALGTNELQTPEFKSGVPTADAEQQLDSIEEPDGETDQHDTVQRDGETDHLESVQSIDPEGSIVVPEESSAENKPTANDIPQTPALGRSTRVTQKLA